MTSLSFVFLGLSITSSWGNGHATTYRGLLRELARRGHAVHFLERDLEFYAQNRDLPDPSYARTDLYRSVEELKDRFTQTVRDADVVVVGSYVPEGIDVSRWVVEHAKGLRAFYDIDTPITLRGLNDGNCEYLDARQAARFDMYLSFMGGPALARMARDFGMRAAKPLYCSADPELYFPKERNLRWDLGYLGTYSADRQPPLDELLLAPARAWAEGRFVVAGPQYPTSLRFPENVDRIQHLSPAEHCDFYNSQRYTLNITRADMRAAGYAPSVRLFEAAACATPILSDNWPGLEQFFTPNREIIVVEKCADVSKALDQLSEERRLELGERARRRFALEHTAAHRAETLERYVLETERTPRAGRARRASQSTDLPTPDTR